LADGSFLVKINLMFVEKLMCAFGVPRWEKAGKTKVNEWLGYDIC
jgi:hypothetical protein